MQLVKVLYCKLPTNFKQLPAFTLEVRLASKLRCRRWEARVLPLKMLDINSERGKISPMTSTTKYTMHEDDNMVAVHSRSIIIVFFMSTNY